MSAPAYDEATQDIWYTDGNSGFYVVRLTKATGITKFARRVVYPGKLGPITKRNIGEFG